MRLVRVTDYTSRAYTDATAILRNSIAPEAQLPEQRFCDLLASGGYQLFAYTRDQDVQGAALVYFSDQLPFAWLDYFAIRSDLRSRGLGSALFREIIQFAHKQDPMPDWLLFEVDDDYESDPKREADCARRVQFYRRMGAQLLVNVPYKFPSAFAAPIQMRLMAYQLHSHATLAPDGLKEVVREVFLNIHGRGFDDELLRTFEENLPDNFQMK